MLKLLSSCPSCSQRYSIRELNKGTSPHHQSRLPLILTCGHTFCENCLTKALQGKEVIKCQICQVYTEVPEKQGIQFLWPDAYIIGNIVLQKQHYPFEDKMIKMVPAAAVPLSKNKNERKVKVARELCNECTRNAVTCRCLKCDVLMCSECYRKVHSVSRSLRTHQAIPVYESERFKQLESICSTHNRPIEYFCQEDEIAICSNCVILGDHKEHSITSLEDQNQKALDDLKPSLQNACKVLRYLKKTDKMLRSMKPQFHSYVTEALETIHRKFQSIHSLLQVREKALYDQVNAICEGALSPISDMRNQVDKDIEILETLLYDVEQIQHNDSHLTHNVQGIVDQLKLVADVPCVLQMSEGEGLVVCDFESQSMLMKMVDELGKVDETSEINVQLKKLSDNSDDNIEGDGQSIDSFTSVSRSNSKESSEAGELSETGSVISEMSSITSILSDITSQGSGDNISHSRKLRIKNIHFPLMGDELVYVVYIKNPCYFIIQRFSERNKLKSLSAHIQRYCMSPESEKGIPWDLLEGDYVLVQFSEDDTWYRGHVMSIIPSMEDEEVQAHIHYIDYGNTDIIPLSRMRKMPKKFEYLPAQAVVCSLMDVVANNQNCTWTSDAAKCFGQLTEDKPMLMKVFEVRDSVHYVDLSKPPLDEVIDDRPVSMRDALVFLGHACLKSNDLQPGGVGKLPKVTLHFLSSPPPQKYSVLDAMISHVSSPTSFYIQQVWETKRCSPPRLTSTTTRIYETVFANHMVGDEALYLSDMMNEIQEVYNEDTGYLWTIFCPVKEQICIAKYPTDNAWYRAIVKDLPGKQMVKVQYVDFGNEEFVPYYCLKKVQKKFLKLPAMAVACTLADVKPVGDSMEWSQEAVTVMTNLFLKPVVAKVSGMVDQKLSILLYEPSSGGKVSVNAMLVQQGLAVSTGPGSIVQELQIIPEKLVVSPERVKVEESVKNSFGEELKSGMETPSKAMSPPKKTSSSNDTHLEQLSLHQQEGIVIKEKMATSAASMRSSLKTGEISMAKLQVQAPEEEERPSGPAVRVSHIETPGHFYVQPFGSNLLCKLDILMSEMQKKYSKSEVTQVVFQAGDYCAAQYTVDKFYYRAKVLQNVDNKELEVLLIDFGFLDKVSTENLRPLQAEFQDPAFSIRCHLADIQPAGDITKWSVTSVEHLKSLVKDVTCYVSQKGELENLSLPVDLMLRELKVGDALSPDEIIYHSIREKMVDIGLALPIRRKVPGKKTIPQGVKDRNIFAIAIPPRLLPHDAAVQAKKADEKHWSDPRPLEEKYVLSQTEKTTKSGHTNAHNEDRPAKENITQKKSEENNKIDIFSTSEVVEDEQIEVEVKEMNVNEGVPTTESNNEPKLDVHQKNRDSPEEDKNATVECKTENRESEGTCHPDDGPKSSGLSAVEESTKCKEEELDEQSETNSEEMTETSDLDVHDDVLEEPERTNEDGTDECNAGQGKWDLQADMVSDRVGFMPPELPTSSVIQAIPTYVGWDCTIYCQQVIDKESPKGQYGYILKENTVETILQDDYLQKHGLFRARIPRDGNCLFRAFAQGLFSDQSHQADLRQKVTEALDAHWDDFESLSDLKKSEYLSQMRQAGTYGGEPELQMLCLIYDIQAVVYMGGLNYKIQERTYGTENNLSKGTIRLLYISDGQYDSGHYDLVVDSADLSNEAERVYQIWREIKVREFSQWNMYEDKLTYDESLLQQIMEHLQCCYENTEPDLSVTYEIGQPVIAQYSEDNQFYRGQITNITDKGISVFYIDFGNTELVQPEKLRDRIILQSIPQQCLECQLVGIKPVSSDGCWSQDMLEYLHTLLLNNECEIHIKDHPVRGQKLLVCLILPDGRELTQFLLDKRLALPLDEPPAIQGMQAAAPLPADVKDIQPTCDSYGEAKIRPLVLPDKIISQYPKPFIPLQGENYPVCVTHMEMPTDVYIQYVIQEENLDSSKLKINENLDKLMEINNFLQTCAEELPELSDLKPGTACVVQFNSDKSWYRAEVLIVNPDGVNTEVGVLFVDYGSTELVPRDRVKSLPMEFLKLPVQAYPVRVVGLMPPKGTTEWPDETLQAIKAIYDSKILIANFKSITVDQVCVELFDFDAAMAQEVVEQFPSAFQALFENGSALPTIETEEGTIIEDVEYEDLI